MDTKTWTTHRWAVAEHASDLLDHDWLLTNGTGSYAMGTPLGCNTRRYHGLLVAATQPPVGRIIALNQMLEQLQPHRPGTDDKPLTFTTCLFRGEDAQPIFEPTGHRMLQRFERGLHIHWFYQAGTVQFERTLFLHHQQPAATLRYRIRGLAHPAQLRLAPMLTLRDFHSMLSNDDPTSFHCYTHDDARDTFTAHRGDAAVTLRCGGAHFEHQQDWWKNFYYPVDAERGQECLEDAFVPGAFVVDLQAGHEHDLLLTVALGEQAAAAQPQVQQRAAHLAPMASALTPTLPDAAVQAADGDADALARALAIAADDFVVARHIRGSNLSTILAGFPWFADWGRDTFIALDGLLLRTGRLAEARRVLQAFAEAIADGLVPNRFDDYDDQAAHYNTVDASLWFIHASIEYMSFSGDEAAWRGWLGVACEQIVHAYQHGTRYDIAMDRDGLIRAGSVDTQLTWMDAACGEVIFTPRHGKAVEINALWHNALAGLAATLKKHDRSKAEAYDRLARKVKRSFNKVFWNDAAGCLVDHLWTDQAGRVHVDASIRPNQIFAVSLPYAPLARGKQKQVVKVVRERLLTPVGLRTLPVDDPAYHPRYSGAQFDRDEAYHQGTIWPWLIGPYVEAVLRSGQFSARARREAAQTLLPLVERLLGDGVGQLHEVHEAMAPHRPVGCCAQAWSVAELIRGLTLCTA